MAARYYFVDFFGLMWYNLMCVYPLAQNHIDYGKRADSLDGLRGAGYGASFQRNVLGKRADWPIFSGRMFHYH
jgi:hypothetical protein